MQIDAFRDDIRIVVIDNHSTDDTALRCEEWKQKGMPFDYICNAENIGMARNIIKCFELAETPYCWVFGDDDMVRIGANVYELVVPPYQRSFLEQRGSCYWVSARPGKWGIDLSERRIVQQ